MQIIYLQPAQRDLARFQDFLQSSGVSKSKSDEILLGLIKRIRVLCKYPLRGYSIGGRYGFETPYRALIAGRYIAIYEVVNNQIQIRRVYHMREDYLSELLPEGHPLLVDDSNEE